MRQSNSESAKYWTPKQFIGKTIFDNNGLNCGKIQSFYIDPKTFTISGIMAKKLLSKEYYLSKDYFDQLKETGLYLNSTPIKPNTKVANTKGKTIGKVIGINYNSDTKKLESIEIKSIFTKKIISSDNIIGIGERITIKA